MQVTEPTLRWIVLSPLLGAAVLGLLNRRLPRAVSGPLACASVGLSFTLCIRLLLRLTGLPAGERLLTDSLYQWIGFGNLHVELGFAMDQLGAVMALVVTGVSFVIHIYSLGYMAHDEGFQRFFTYLNLFVFAMLMLVLGENLLILFIGWEGVGLCSYLLISFWFNEEANATAGKKAFIVNRIGDFGFLVGLVLLGTTLLPHLGGDEGLFSFRTLAAHRDLLAPVATALGLLFFVGATGKSAQIPLYIWLPDAMAGPTPVSALIHAATMVTAGVYLIARLNFLYVLSPVAMQVIAGVGALTAIFAATIALTQNDIKKVLAYSTVSQLGYMMLACGVGAFAAGIFHLMTHAFFKALLFLGSGSVIHALSGEQDLRRMGGLARRLPVTFWTFLCATLAIAGIFPMAGFFSKDEILWRAFSSERGGLLVWALGFLAAGLTAFYMMRLVILAFAGQNRAADDVQRHIHESPVTMTLPLVILALLSLAGGWIGWPRFLGGQNHFEQWLAPVFGGEPPAHAAARTGLPAVDALAVPLQNVVHASQAVGQELHQASQEWLLMFCSLGIALLGLGLGSWVYARRPEFAGKATHFFGGFLYRTLLNKYYVDELYAAALIKPGYILSERVLWKWIDVGVIDGLLARYSALCVSILGALLRLFQTGRLRFYAYVFALGVTAFVLYLTFSS